MSALAEEIEQAVRKVLREELPRMLGAERSSGHVALDPNVGLSVPEAAKVAHRAPDTVRRAIRAGALRASHPEGGREWVIAPVDLEAWLGRRKRTPAVVDIGTLARQAAARALADRR